MLQIVTQYLFNCLQQAGCYYLVYGFFIGDIINHTHHISLWRLKKNNCWQTEKQKMSSCLSWRQILQVVMFIYSFNNIDWTISCDDLLLKWIVLVCSLKFYGVLTFIISSLRTSLLCSFSVGVENKWKVSPHASCKHTTNTQKIITAGVSKCNKQWDQRVFQEAGHTTDKFLLLYLSSLSL